MLENAVNEICWVFLVIKTFTSRNIFGWSRFKCFQEEIKACCPRKNSRYLTTAHLRTWKKKQNGQLFCSFLFQHLVQLTLVVPGTFLTRLNWSVPFWTLNHEAKPKIVPIDPANQNIDSCAFVKTVLMIPVLFLWHTCLQKSKLTACRNNVDSKMTNAAWTCCLRHCKPSKKSFCL